MQKKFIKLFICSAMLCVAGCQSTNAALKPFSEDVITKDKVARTNSIKVTGNYNTEEASVSAPVVAAPAPIYREPAPIAAKSVVAKKAEKKPLLGFMKKPDVTTQTVTPATVTPAHEQITPAELDAISNQAYTALQNDSSAYARPDPEPIDIKSFYKLGIGDKVRINVYGEPDLSGEFAISSEGTVSMPLIGEVTASGRTLDQLRLAITNTLKGAYLRDPQVSAEVIGFRPFYILGEVNKPGMYPYSAGLVLDNAIAIGGGYTYRAEKRKFYIKHEKEQVETEVPITGIIYISPGDTIRIAERIF
jgi:polysaccharide export outer membrane protein